jgi:hypothetical protein
MRAAQKCDLYIGQLLTIREDEKAAEGRRDAT